MTTGVTGNVRVFLEGDATTGVADVVGKRVDLDMCDHDGAFAPAGTCDELVRVETEDGLVVTCTPGTMLMLWTDAYRGWTRASDIRPGMKLMCVAKLETGRAWVDDAVASCERVHAPGTFVYEYAYDEAGDGADMGPDGSRPYSYTVNGIAVLHSRSHHYDPGAQDTNESAERAAILDRGYE